MHEVEYHAWENRLRRVAFRFNWADYILGSPIPLPAANNQTAEEVCNLKNAFLVITTSCAGHEINDKLNDCPMGDARRAFQIVRESVYRPTAAGRQLANKNFYNMSMAVTDTTIGGFIALANRNRKVVESSGDTVTDAGMV